MTLHSWCFGAPKQHNPLRVNTVIEKPNHFSLQFRIHIYKQIPARKDVNFSKRRMHDQVMLCKHDRFPYFCIDTIPVLCFTKKSF